MYKLALLTGGCNHVVAVSSLASAIRARTLSLLVAGLAGLGSGDFSLDIFTLLEHLLPSEEVSNTVDEHVDEVDLGVSESVSVGDIELTTFGSGVNTGTTSSLESEFAAELLEAGSGGELGDEAHSSSTETSSTVGGAGEDVSEMVVVHEVGTVGDEDILDGSGGVAESLEDSADVVSLLHGDDSGVVLFVDPDEEVSGIVVEDTSGVGPVATTSRGEKEGGVGLLEEVTSGLELLGVLLGHTSLHLVVRARSVERVVLSSELTLEAAKTLDNEGLNLSSLLEAVARRESEASDGSSGSASGGEDVLTGGVDLSVGELADIHVGGVLVVGAVSSVSGGEDGLHDVSKHSPGLFITSDETAGLDHGVTLVINTGLDAVTDVDSKRGLHALVLGVDAGVLLEDISAEGSVLREIGELVGEVFSRESGSLLGANVLRVSASELDPLGVLLDSGVETSRRVINFVG